MKQFFSIVELEAAIKELAPEAQVSTGMLYEEVLLRLILHVLEELQMLKEKLK